MGHVGRGQPTTGSFGKNRTVLNADFRSPEIQ